MIEVILQNIRQIGSGQEVAIRDWLSDNVGQYGVHYWTVAVTPQNPTRNEFGFRADPSEVDLCVKFSDPNMALLFKLTWGGL